MKVRRTILIGAFFVLLFSSCGAIYQEPIETIADLKDELHSKIEDTTQSIFPNQNYQSLAFGELKVFRPEEFDRLDSVYAIKTKFINNNDYLGLQKSGVNEVIPGYRAAAQEVLNEVEYEIEHLYQTSDSSHLHIYHAFYLFDYQHNLIGITPFYDFRIDEKHKSLYYSYQFGYHFVDDRNLYISKGEQEFIRFFKAKEITLIHTDELQSFMNHTMKTMQLAKEVNSIDFRKISQKLVFDLFKASHKEKQVVVEKFGKLYARKGNEGRVKFYEISIFWSKEGKNYETIYQLSPYLELVTVRYAKTI